MYNLEVLVTGMARELGVRTTQIVLSFNDNVIGMGLTAEDCGVVDYSRLTVTYIDDEIKTEQQVREPTCNGRKQLPKRLID